MTLPTRRTLANPVVALLLLLLSAVSSSSLPPEDGIRIISAEKQLNCVQIHLTGPIARVILTLEVENAAAATDASRVLLAFWPWEVEHLAIVRATRVEGKHRKKAHEPLRVEPSDLTAATPNGACLFSALLSTHLKPGEATTLEVLYVLTHAVDPYPAAIVGRSESQLVYYHDSAVLLTPYHVLEQATYIKLPSNRIESITMVDPTSRAGAEIKYGTYYNQMPITYLRISVCYEVGPFAVVEKLERKVDIPCQGHIKVTDQYKMRHDVAWYKRIFSRPECPRIWPLANTLSSSIKDRLYFTLLQGPRYGWHCTPSFTAGYGLPLEDFLFESVDGRRYINLTFGIPQLDTVVDDFATTVAACLEQ
ncbi:dolichyl-diphosphooligosaccharide--protein glycosyltransferase subunit 1B-like isoform X3 [Panicum virgatum]|uniref:dolichyl-diphosphooligosaccharide--protein glycosyltransferase subunit 1B-like isoform X3 n=1 Tax=Panicum virgatum TaxID=38727 RepID=UPI0019D5E889|nr:dolichyl-diphosphooligosaccharide--protein glycosyltransferase subunit 1B-like isoform X3 [Panicum virgatum]